MVERPERHIDAFASAGADSITIHREATAHVNYALSAIREKGCVAGLALNPGHAVRLQRAEGLLRPAAVHDGEPRLGRPALHRRLGRADRRPGVRSLPDGMPLEVDGGIDADTAKGAAAAGATAVRGRIVDLRVGRARRGIQRARGGGWVASRRGGRRQGNLWEAPKCTASSSSSPSSSHRWRCRLQRSRATGSSACSTTRAWASRPPGPPSPGVHLRRARSDMGVRSRPSRRATRTPTSTSSRSEGNTYASVGTLGIGPNGGGQQIFQLTSGNRVAPRSVKAYPSASCISDPSAAHRACSTTSRRRPRAARSSTPTCSTPTGATRRSLSMPPTLPGAATTRARWASRRASGRARDHRRDRHQQPAGDRADQPHRRGAHGERGPAPAPHRLRGHLRLGGRQRRRRARQRARRQRRLDEAQPRRVRGRGHVVVHELPGRHHDRQPSARAAGRRCTATATRARCCRSDTPTRARSTAATSSRSIPATASPARAAAR